MVIQKWVSEGLFTDIKKAEEFWINKTNRLCSKRTEKKYGKIELFIKKPFYVL